MAKLSEAQIQLIRETYARVGTYSGTAKICGNSVATVKKYVELGSKEVSLSLSPSPAPTPREIKLFTKKIPSIEEIGEVKINDDLMRLTYFEKEESVIFQQEEL